MTVANESARTLNEKAAQAITQATQFVAIRTGMIALETEATQEGRRILQGLVASAGLDLTAFAWQAAI